MFIDKLILGFFQKLTEKIQQYIGIDCLQIARGSLYLLIILYVSEMMLYLSKGSIASVVGVLFQFIVWPLLIFSSLTRAERDRDNLKGKPFKNKNELTLQVPRLLTVVILFVSLIIFFLQWLTGWWVDPNSNWTTEKERLRSSVDLASSVMLFLTYYLVSCTPMPPTDGKVNEWLQNLSRHFLPEPTLAFRSSP